MKKNIVIAAMLMLLGFTSALAAGPTRVNDNVRHSFKKEFSKGEFIKMEAFSAYSKVTFKVNGEIMFAYYTGNGELLAVAKNILSDKLPVHLASSMKKHYSGFWISDLFEIRSNGEVSYYVTLENADYKVVLKSADSDRWEVYSNIHKDVEN